MPSSRFLHMLRAREVRCLKRFISKWFACQLFQACDTARFLHMLRAFEVRCLKRCCSKWSTYQLLHARDIACVFARDQTCPAACAAASQDVSSVRRHKHSLGSSTCAGPVTSDASNASLLQQQRQQQLLLLLSKASRPAVDAWTLNDLHTSYSRLVT